MGFSEQINGELAKGLDDRNVTTREDSSKARKYNRQTAPYLEGWFVIETANQIFGFDGWTREMVENTLVQQEQKPTKSGSGENWWVSYTVRIRITVGEIVREGSGFGQGIDKDLGMAHESAIKEAETDSMKRAFMTFGNRFGLALYDKTLAGVVSGGTIEQLWTLINAAYPDLDARADYVGRVLTDLGERAQRTYATVEDLPTNAIERWIEGLRKKQEQSETGGDSVQPSDPSR